MIAFSQLRNCLVNLPSHLSQALVNANTVRSFFKSLWPRHSDFYQPAQNVVVQLDYRIPSETATASRQETSEKTVFVGWTGLSSQSRATASRYDQTSVRHGSNERGVGTVEIDSIFGRMLGIAELSKVRSSRRSEGWVSEDVSRLRFSSTLTL